MANQVMDDRILVTEEYTEDDKTVIKDNPDLPVYPEIVISQEDITDLGREVSTEDVAVTERVDCEEISVSVFNSFIDTVSVLLPVEEIDTTDNEGVTQS